MHSRPLSAEEEQQALAQEGVLGKVHRTAATIIDQQRELIEAKFPPLNRCLTGYDLAHLREEGQLNLNSLLCGSEGSLGFLNEAVLNVLPIPKHSTLVNVRYPSFMDALRDAKALMASSAKPTSIETVDDTVLQLAMEDFVWDSVAEFFPAGSTPIQGINLIEFNDDDPEQLAGRVKAFTQHLSQDATVERLGYTLAEGRPQIQKVYAMRKRSVGLLGNVQGGEASAAVRGGHRRSAGTFGRLHYRVPRRAGCTQALLRHVWPCGCGGAARAPGAGYERPRPGSADSRDF
ncbi:hypothetical protein HAALTHF_45660n [Vreelandella aquamarina]|nr:hypothetical protein HAALTHF_45660n [Halomonas axialensis]